MAISKNVELRIKDDKASLSEKIILYMKDKGIDLYFKIVGLSYQFTNGINSTYIGAIIKKPDDTFLTFNGLQIANEQIKLSVTQAMIDELKEVGTHEVQFFIYENSSMTTKVTIPSITFEIKEPLQ